jgi:hypothetical protein
VPLRWPKVGALGTTDPAAILSNEGPNQALKTAWRRPAGRSPGASWRPRVLPDRLEPRPPSSRREDTWAAPTRDPLRPAPQRHVATSLYLKLRLDELEEIQVNVADRHAAWGTARVADELDTAACVFDREDERNLEGRGRPVIDASTA